MIKETIKDAEARMKGAILSLEEDLSGIRTSRLLPVWLKNCQLITMARPLL